MSTLSRVTTWVSGDTLTATDLNAEFDGILSDYNGSVSNVNIASDAAITSTKISGTAVTLTSQRTITTASDGATVTFVLTSGNIHQVTLGGNRTLALSGAATGQSFIVRLIQDGTGSRTVTWWSTIKWAGGTAPVLTTTASSVDVFGFICTGTGTYDGYVVSQNLS